MARIRNLKVYRIKPNPTKDDFVIGTCAKTGKTYNFRISSLCGICSEDTPTPTPPTPTPTPPSNPEIYSFQFPNMDLTSNISNASTVNYSYAQANGTLHITQSILNGKDITFNNVSRFGFAVFNTDNNPYKILDFFNQDVTNVIFETFYNSAEKIMYYISKEYITPSKLYYKFVKQ